MDNFELLITYTVIPFISVQSLQILISVLTTSDDTNLIFYKFVPIFPELFKRLQSFYVPENENQLTNLYQVVRILVIKFQNDYLNKDVVSKN